MKAFLSDILGAIGLALLIAEAIVVMVAFAGC